MVRPYGIELRERVVSHVEAGHTHRATASHFDVSIKFVSDMIKLNRETGGLTPKVQGNRGRGKLTPVVDWVERHIRANGNLTLAELADALDETHTASAFIKARSGACFSVLQAAEQKRADVSARRYNWVTRRQPFMRDFLHRLVFIDETLLKTNMTFPLCVGPV